MKLLYLFFLFATRNYPIIFYQKKNKIDYYHLSIPLFGESSFLLLLTLAVYMIQRGVSISLLGELSFLRYIDREYSC